MRNLSIVALIGLSGCSLLSTKWEGIWFVQIPVADPSTCEFKGDENFDDADFPDIGGPVDTNWTITDEADMSDSAVMVEIMKGHSGQLFMVMGDRVFPSTSTSKSFTATWAGTTQDSHTESHDAGYDFSDDIKADSTETITLTKGAGGVFNGTWAVSSTFTEDYKESDQWKVAQVGLPSGQIPSNLYLTGRFPTNTAADQECGNDCTLSLTTTCDGSLDISAMYAGNYNDGLFAAVEDSSQAAGAAASSGGGYGGYTTYYYSY